MGYTTQTTYLFLLLNLAVAWFPLRRLTRDRWAGGSFCKWLASSLPNGFLIGLARSVSSSKEIKRSTSTETTCLKMVQGHCIKVVGNTVFLDSKKNKSSSWRICFLKCLWEDHGSLDKFQHDWKGELHLCLQTLAKKSSWLLMVDLAKTEDFAGFQKCNPNENATQVNLFTC